MPSARAALDAGISQRYEAHWQAHIPTGAKHYSVQIQRDETPSPTTGGGTKPAAVTIVFDADDPPTDNPFNAERNIDHRPEREIAILRDGVEVARRFCPVPFTAEGSVPTALSFAFVTGGAEVSITVDKSLVYDHFLLPGVTPFPARLRGDDAAVTSFDEKQFGVAPRNPPPVSVRALDNVLVALNRPGDTSWANFPRDAARIGRVICTFTLAKTSSGLDPWDRVGSVYVYDEKGERFEILRFITPYRRAYQWQQDVTDLLPLLSGKRRVQIDCTTYGVGWLASVDFTFYPGPTANGRHPYRVINLWNTTALLGQAKKPFAGFAPPLTIPIDARADSVSVRTLVTGHGEDPNTDNAGEFLSLWRKLTVGGATYQNTLWKDDNYLNTLRPQGGTWKYDRAGWGPGTVVEPWMVDITPNVKPGLSAHFTYTIQDYVNKTPNDGDPARHIISSQLIFYRRG